VEEMRGAKLGKSGSIELVARRRIDFMAPSCPPVPLTREGRGLYTKSYDAPTSKEERRDIAFVPLPSGELALVVAAVWPRRRPLNAALSELVDGMKT
jgi:hypothetical protein